MIVGMIPPDSGRSCSTTTFDTAGHVPRAQKGISYLPQEASFSASLFRCEDNSSSMAILARRCG